MSEPDRFMELQGKEKWEEGPGGKEGESMGERQIYPVNNSLCSLHSLEPSEMYMDLYREEKREEGDRGEQKKKRGNQKERDRSRQYSVP